MNLPNKLTMLRILLIPVFIVCFYMPLAQNARYVLAMLVFSLAYITDIYDGQLARKRNIVTNFGKLMDPIADKLLSSAAFVMLVADGLMSPVAAVVIIGREFIISGFRLVAVGGGNVIAASWLGKIKTISQCVAVGALLLWPTLRLWPVLRLLPFRLDQLLLWVSVLFTIWSGVDYIVKNKGTIQFK